MPDFDDSTGFKMKGSSFYGHGNQSPNKIIGALLGGVAKKAAAGLVGKGVDALTKKKDDDAPTDYNPAPAKQLKGKYMRTPQEKAFYESSESKDYEPEPSGKYRGIGSYSKNKKTGDVVTKGIAGSKPKKKVESSEKIGPVESTKAIKAKEAASDKAREDQGNVFSASKEARSKTDKAYAAEEDAKSYVKKK